MSRRAHPELLSDVLEAIRRIEAYTKSVTYEGFLRDMQVQDAVVRNLEIIGEAVKKLDREFKKQHQEIDWKKIAGLRDRVIHDYFGVNWDIVWDVVRNKAPELKRQLERLLHA